MIVGDTINEDRLDCIRSMTFVYHKHAAQIGPFQSFKHIMKLLDYSPNPALQFHILQFIRALVNPYSSLVNGKAQDVSRVNADHFIKGGGIGLCCDHMIMVYGSIGQMQQRNINKMQNVHQTQ